MWYLLDLFDMYSKTEHRRYILCSTSSTSFVIICLFWIWCQGATKDWESQDLGRSQDLKTMEDVTVFQRRCFLHSGEFSRMKTKSFLALRLSATLWCLMPAQLPWSTEKNDEADVAKRPFRRLSVFLSPRRCSMCQDRFFLNQNGGKRCENV